MVANHIQGSSLYAQRLHQFIHKDTIKSYKKVEYPKILIAGCGDSLPLQSRLLEPKFCSIHGVDISQVSLSKAQKRISLFAKKRGNVSFEKANLEEVAFAPESFHHIDSFGVIHHCQNPKKAINNLASSLAEGGTARIMVYNPESRKFLNTLTEVLRKKHADTKKVGKAKRDLFQIVNSSESLCKKISQMKTILNNDNQFADTFLHPHNLLLPYEQWTRWFSECGLEPIGIYDRYGELDDLKSPLHFLPSKEQILERSLDRRFENNFEFYLVKNSSKAIKINLSQYTSHFYERRPPSSFSQFSEIASLSKSDKIRIYSQYLQTHICCHDMRAMEVNSKTIKRLFRLGYIDNPKSDIHNLSIALEEKMEGLPPIEVAQLKNDSIS